MAIKETNMIQPSHEKILVRPYAPDKVTEGGIIVPDSVQQRPSKAYVLAVGCGVKDRPMIFKEGDTVFHIKNAGTPVEHEGELLYILRDVDCLAFIRPKEKEKYNFSTNGSAITTMD